MTERLDTPVREGRGWGPSVEGRARRGRRPLRALALLLVALLVLAAAVPLFAVARIPKVPVDGLAASGRPMHVLVVGSDSREDLTPEQRRELGTGSAEGERTDTIFLLTVQGRDAAMLAFPRDLWVPRCDGTVGRINVAQSLGGPGCLVDTVHELSGIDVHHYVSVSFGGFRDVVDAVGGVELCLEDPISDRDAHIDLPAGCQVLDGRDALGFVRVRKIDNDLQRIQRQQRFVQALAREVAHPSTMLNPVRVIGLSNEIGGAVTTSDSVGVTALARLGLGARDLAGGSVPTFTVPVEAGTTSGGAAVLHPLEAEAEALFARFRDGSVLGSGTDALTPGDVRVTVLNGAGVSGLAGQVGELLEGRGYDVAEIGNADLRDTTLVRYPPGQRGGAELVAQDLPADTSLQESSEVTVVTVVLGRDLTGAL